MASLGQFLQRERELRGITLKEISSTTKISLKFLQALEEDNLDILPGEFFIKGIIRSYAKAIGLEEDYVLNKFYEESILKKEPQTTEQKKEKIRTSIFQKKEKFPNLIFFIILIVIVVISIYFITRPNKTPVSLLKQEIIPQTQEEEIIPPPEIEEQTPEKEKELILVITFLEDTWIQIFVDGELIINGIIKAGEENTINALDEIFINLGNAGGISYSINGKQGKSFGSSGAVRKNIRITLENYTDFVIQEEG